MLWTVIFLFLFPPLSVSDSAIRESCFSGKELLNHCKCKVLSSDVSLSRELYTFPETKLGLLCNGSAAFESANKILKLLEDSVLFVDLSLLSMSSKRISYEDLKYFTNLRHLVISDSNVNSIDPETFKDMVDLRSLDLSRNKFTEISSDVFKYLIGLKNFSLANNKITTVESDAFQHMTGLLHLDLSGNKLYEVESDWFAGAKKLNSLSLASNNIFSVKVNSFQHLISLKVLDLSSNELTELSHPVFFHLGNLRSLFLASNKLQTLSENTFKGNKFLQKVNLTGNPWVCDKALLPLSEWLKTHEADRANCVNPPDLSNLTLQQGLLVVYLEIEVNRSTICNASMCNCTVSRDKQIVTVDCAGRYFTKLPESLPYKARVLDLQNNNIRSLSLDHINASQWSDVTFLHLNNNLISSLKGLEGKWLPRTLVAFHLSNNQLTEIPFHMLEQFRGGQLDELYLSGNPWNCDCNTVRFQTWLQDNFKTVKDYGSIRCSPDSSVHANELIFDLPKSKLCPQHIQLINYLDVLNALMTIAIILIILKLSYDFWLQKRTGKLPRFFSLNMSK